MDVKNEHLVYVDDSSILHHYLSLQGQLARPGSLLFRAGMSIEAKDRHNPSMICAATIKNINPQGKLLIHFDGWSQQYDYWCEPSSTDIHPPMWCGKNNRRVEAPHGERDSYYS